MAAASERWALHHSRIPWATPVAADALRVRLATGPGAFRTVLAEVRDRYAGGGEYAPLRPLGRTGDRQWWEATLRLPTRRFAYRFRLEDQLGRNWWVSPEGTRAGTGGDVWFEYPYIGEGDLHTVPSWAAGAVFYQIFPDRFENGDPGNDPPGSRPWGETPGSGSFFGGDLEGVRRRLPYLAELGVQGIYLTPIFEAPTNHRYDTSDYYAVDPALGTEGGLRALVGAAHALGLKVVLDGVFNHCGAGFAPFRDAAAHGPASPYWDWFRVAGSRIETSPPNYETFANGIATMPKLLTHRPAVRAYLLAVATYWLESVGIDGWRLDVANEVDHAFWRAFREAVRAVAPEALLIGEVWHDATAFLDGSEFDTVMGYPWRRAALDLSGGRTDVGEFAGGMAALGAQTPPPALHLSMNLLGSHDVERVRTHLGGSVERALLAAGMQLTWPGMPSIYYGDEVGMEGGGDPDCRRCMNWSPDATGQRVLARYRQLCHLRRMHPALARGGLREVGCDPAANGYAFVRTHADGDVLVGFNAGKHPWGPTRPDGALRLDGDSDVLPALSVGLWACPPGSAPRPDPLRAPGAGLDWEGASGGVRR